uniref:Uncharacterized protein n=1 Tax=Clytia hemisphaerica TaxID=252671 RepID=A0A7M6DNX7_9CNID
MCSNNFMKLFLLLIFQQICALESINFESFQVDEGECSMGEPGIEVKSTTECLLHCGMEKCMNSLIKNQTCYCTDTECVPQRKQQSLHEANFFTSLQKLTMEPICYGAKEKSFARLQIRETGRIKYFKMVHVSGGVTCAVQLGYSRWGCPGRSAESVYTAMTDVYNHVVAPRGTHNHGIFQVQGANHMTDDTLTLFSNAYDAFEQGQEIRVWYTEDLFEYYGDDNGGTQCVHIFAKYC